MDMNLLYPRLWLQQTVKSFTHSLHFADSPGGMSDCKETTPCDKQPLESYIYGYEPLYSRLWLQQTVKSFIRSYDLTES
jgi:hypothetical protein